MIQHKHIYIKKLKVHLYLYYIISISKCAHKMFTKKSLTLPYLETFCLKFFFKILLTLKVGLLLPKLEGEILLGFYFLDDSLKLQFLARCLFLLYFFTFLLFLTDKDKEQVRFIFSIPPSTWDLAISPRVFFLHLGVVGMRANYNQFSQLAW